MAVGWTRDGAVQEQIEASVADAVKRARRNMKPGESALFCKKCGVAIQSARRAAVPGVQICVTCQSVAEDKGAVAGEIKRRR